MYVTLLITVFVGAHILVSLPQISHHFPPICSSQKPNDPPKKNPTPNNPPKPSGFGPSGARPPPRSRSRSQQSTATRTFPHPRNVCPRASGGSVGREGEFPGLTEGNLLKAASPTKMAASSGKKENTNQLCMGLSYPAMYGMTSYPVMF